MDKTQRLEQEVLSLRDMIRKGQGSFDKSAYNSANTANGGYEQAA